VTTRQTPRWIWNEPTAVAASNELATKTPKTAVP
jgi:hypothetical protein